jgi:hypothetical protein
MTEMTSDLLTRLPGSHHRVEVNGIRMHFSMAGSGEPIVLLHDAPALASPVRIDLVRRARNGDAASGER